jgi:hypothetical protein
MQHLRPFPADFIRPYIPRFGPLPAVLFLFCLLVGDAIPVFSSISPASDAGFVY